MNIIAAISAVALHLLVLFALIVPHNEEVKEQVTETAKTEERKDARIIEATLFFPVETKGTGPGGQQDCKQGEDFYYGIGIRHLLSSREVIEAPPSYPAFKAGIRVGDYLVDYYNLPGGDGVVHVLILRDGLKKMFRVQKENICFAKE